MNHPCCEPPSRPRSMLRDRPLRMPRPSAASRQRAARRQADFIAIHNAREHNLQNVDVDIPRNQFTVITGVSGSRQVHARLRHPVRRRPAALPGIAQRLRAPVRAAVVAPGRGRDLRHPAHGGDRAAHQPRRPEEHGGDADRDLPLPAPDVRQARHAILPRLRCGDRAAELRCHRRAHAARLSRPAHRPARAAGHQPQGLLHRSRQVGQGQGLRLPARRRRVPADGEMAAPRPLSRAHASNCRWPTCASRRRTKRHCAQALARALDFGKGIVHVLGGLDRLAEAAGNSRKAARVELALPQTIFSTKRACPSCARSFPELDPRLFSFNSKHGWCASLPRHRREDLRLPGTGLRTTTGMRAASRRTSAWTVSSTSRRKAT